MYIFRERDICICRYVSMYAYVCVCMYIYVYIHTRIICLFPK